MIKFTSEQLKTLSGIFHDVWDYIAYDCLQATQECEGRDHMKRDEVIEMCLDADRPDDFAKSPEQKALLKQFKELSYDDQLRLARKMFTFSRYGM